MALLLAAAILLAQGQSALAYIDPGTSQALWSSLAPVFGMIIGCLALALIPLRFFCARIAMLWRKSPKPLRWTAGIAAAAALVAGGLTAARFFTPANAAPMTERSSKPPMKCKRAVVLGMDGLDPNILERMMDAGKLPHFAELRDKGMFARLKTATPPESPVAWLCAATGVNPGKHGVFDFIGRDPKRYLPKLSILQQQTQGPMGLSGSKYVPASAAVPFWKILQAAGVATRVLRWPVTFPAQPEADRLLSGLGTPDVLGTLGQYTFVTTASLAEDDKAPDRVIGVEWAGDVIETELSGPRIMSLTGEKTSTLPLRLERLESGSKLRVTLGGLAAVELEPGDWSEWLPLNFPGGFSKKCPAMVKLYMTGVSPDLALYITPLNIDPNNPAFAVSHPPEFAREMAADMGRYTTLGLPEDTQAARHGRIPLDAFLEMCDQITTEREAMLKRELASFDTGLLAIVFDTSDRIQHMFWAAHDAEHPAHTKALSEQYGHVIEAHYLRMDRVLGETLQATGDDTAVFVLSDHGFTRFARAAHVNRWLIDAGFMTLKPDATEGGPLLRDVDWSRTTAYAVGFCSIYLNLKGREGKGVVGNDAERRETIERLCKKIKLWADPLNGEPVVRNVYTYDIAYHGERIDDAPDVVVGFYPGYRASWQTALGAAPAGEAIVDNTDLWTGDHLVDPSCVPGVFLSSVACDASNPRLIDVAPTVLKIFDVARPDHLDGRALF